MKSDLCSAGEHRPWADGMGQIAQRCRWYPLRQRFRIECNLREGAHSGNLLVFESSLPFQQHRSVFSFPLYTRSETSGRYSAEAVFAMEDPKANNGQSV